MAKIGYLMVNQGKWNEKQIVSEDWVRDQKWIIHVIRKSNDLFVRMPDGEIAQLFPLSPDHFFCSLKGVGEYQIYVERDKKGQLKQVVREIGFHRIPLVKLE